MKVYLGKFAAYSVSALELFQRATVREGRARHSRGVASLNAIWRVLNDQALGCVQGSTSELGAKTW